jgi:hypothetical protein
MAMRQLRVYLGPESDPVGRQMVAERPRAGTVRTTFGEILPLLADAVASRRAWLDDFVEDEIELSSDLHDVLQAYRNFRRPGA